MGYKAITVKSGIPVQSILKRECETKALKKANEETLREQVERASDVYAKKHNVP